MRSVGHNRQPSLRECRRSTDARVHIGNVLNDAFADVGSAGGHREMAGGEVPLGIFADYTDDDPQLTTIVERVVTSRLVENLNDRTGEGDRGSAIDETRPT